MIVGAALWSARMPRPVPAFLAGLGAFLAVLGAGIVVETILGQRGLNDWTQASTPITGVLLITAASVIVGAGAALLAKGLPFDTSADSFAPSVMGETPTMDLADAERAVFVETISASWMMMVSGVVVGLGAVTWVATEWWFGLIFLFSALPIGLLSAFRVHVDQSGLTVRSALFGIQFARVRIEEVKRATVLHVEPTQWGGWGYRGSLKMAGSAAVVVRRGPGIHLQLSGNRSFVVTLEDPRTPAAILNAQLNEIRPTRPR